MSWWENQNEGDGDDSDADEESEFKNSSDRIIFLIDARVSMFQANANGEIQFFNCLKVALEVLKSKIIADDASSIGITFFGTREKDSPEGPDNVFTFLPLGPPSAARIRQLQMIINSPGEFDRLISHQSIEKKSCPLKQALWTCSQSFATKDLKKNDFKRIWLFTNDDNPNAGFPVEQKATVTVARDCSQAGIEISLWHLNAGDRNFDPKTYYFQLLVAASADGDSDVESSIDNRMLGAGFDGFDSLLASVRRKAYRKRRLCSTQFSLDPRTGTTDENQQKVHMGVQIFVAIHIAKKPTHTWLHSATNQPVKSITRYIASNTGEVVANDQIDTYVEVGSDQISISKERTDELKYLGNVPGVGLRLICFIPADRLPRDYNISTPYLLYPHEKAVKGSALMFEALLRNCAKKKVLPVVRFNRTDRTSPRLAVLWPQLEEVDEDGCQVVPPAFHLIPMPFSDELRFCPVRGDPELVIPEEAQSAARDLVLALKDATPEEFRYDKEIENPVLRLFYAVLQAVALNSDTLEWQAQRDDNMRPSAELNAKCDAAAVAFRDAVGISEEDCVPAKVLYLHC